MAVDIIQRIKEFKPQESYILTYNFDLQFYENFFLPVLQRVGCNKNIVILDSSKLNEEINHCFPNIRKLGREYAAVPIYSHDSFHPKIYFFKKEIKEGIHILCIIGSGNLTYPGLNTNYELFADTEWKGHDFAPNYIKSLWDYIAGLLDDCPGETINIFNKRLKEGYPQNFQTSENNKDFIVFAFPNSENIFEKFTAKIAQNKIEKLFVTAPFFDSDLSALTKLIKHTNPSNIEIMIQPSTVFISKENLKRLISKSKYVRLLEFRKEDYQKRL